MTALRYAKSDTTPEETDSFLQTQSITRLFQDLLVWGKWK